MDSLDDLPRAPFSFPPSPPYTVNDLFSDPDYDPNYQPDGLPRPGDLGPDGLSLGPNFGLPMFMRNEALGDDDPEYQPDGLPRPDEFVFPQGTLGLVFNDHIQLVIP